MCVSFRAVSSDLAAVRPLQECLWVGLMWSVRSALWEHSVWKARVMERCSSDVRDFCAFKVLAQNGCHTPSNLHKQEPFVLHLRSVSLNKSCAVVLHECMAPTRDLFWKFWRVMMFVCWHMDEWDLKRWCSTGREAQMKNSTVSCRESRVCVLLIETQQCFGECQIIADILWVLDVDFMDMIHFLFHVFIRINGLCLPARVPLVFENVRLKFYTNLGFDVNMVLLMLSTFSRSVWHRNISKWIWAEFDL